MSLRKWIYAFEEGDVSMKPLLGGKGANLADMTRAGLPVPPGFTITTDACRAFYEKGEKLPDGLPEQLRTAVAELERRTGRAFGGIDRPLLVSVRSGAVTSMPGMMDTILNVGLNDATVEGLAAETGNPRFARDCYRRLIEMFGNVVFGIEARAFDRAKEEVKLRYRVHEDTGIPEEGLRELVERYRTLIREKTRRDFPQNAHEQLLLAVEAVFRSWNNPRAIVYRKAHRIPDDQGTAVNIQAMVFGNLGDDSGTGVVFTRDPSTGLRALFGEYLPNAQGEDVVAGIRTPMPIARLKTDFPDVYAQLVRLAEQLERRYRDMQDVEFTVERGRLYLLQTRSGKRTARAAVRIAADLVREGLISKEEALMRIEPSHLDGLLHRSIDENGPLDVVAEGLPASPGAASGRIAFDADTAVERSKTGEPVLLVRPETTPDDIHGVIAAEGVLTTRGGMTSHAAVVARGMGKPCVCGCESVRIDERERVLVAGGRIFREGDWLSIDGSTGRVIAGRVSLKEPELSEELELLLSWADEVKRLSVRANADTPEDAARARRFGAEGIGLCRTEHMFLSPERLPVVRSMILDEGKRREEALARLLELQQSDFEAIFEAMDGLPVTVRLLDPPLHEFLPDLETLLLRRQRLDFTADGADGADAEPEREELDRLIRAVRQHRESNPMLGLRGCRLGVVRPDIYEMQVRAIFRAAKACSARGVDVRPEIMVPLVGIPGELRFFREMIDRIAGEELGESRGRPPYRVGTMIEVPRAALVADAIAEYADFFSFGTNDLTQMTFGFSRDDAENKFLGAYLERGLLTDNPFQTLDADGVGRLVRFAVERSKAVRPDLKTSICGEHGGDPNSIRFCHNAGLDAVSCSPYRVPLARVAAAQAAIEAGRKVETKS